MAQIDAYERQVMIARNMERGQDTYAGRLNGWHQLGEVSGEFQTWKEMLVKAKADFHVFKSQLNDGMGRKVDAWGTFRWNLEDKAAGAKDKTIFLDTVGKDYTVIQHTEGFKLMDELVGSVDGAHYETMGCLDYGRVVWGQVDPNVKIRVGDDVSDIFLTFYTSHDRTRGFDIYETAERAVCRNTLRIGSLSRLANSMKVRHTKNAMDRINNLKADIGEIKTMAMSMQERLGVLSKKRITKPTLLAIMDKLFPQKEDEDGKKVETKRRENILAEVLSLYDSNDNNAFPEFRGTGYNLLNAVTEYTDHVRGAQGGDKGRAKSALFGSGAALKNNALEVITELTKDAPEMLYRGMASVPGSESVVAELLAK